jgi:hypothetical protein
MTIYLKEPRPTGFVQKGLYGENAELTGKFSLSIFFYSD